MALQSGSGLSTLTTGLIGALRKRKLSVGVLKLGSPLEQLAHYRKFTGRLCFTHHPWNSGLNFDSVSILARASAGAEFLLIEGQEGIYDEFPEGYGASTPAMMLHDLSAPAVVIIQAPFLREGIAAVVKGVANFDPRAGIRGVIILGTEAGEIAECQRRALTELERDAGIALLGIIPRSEVPLVDYSPEIPHSGGLTRSRIISTVELVERYVDLNRLLELAADAPAIPIEKRLLTTKSRVCRIAVADDMTSHVMFQENLDLLKREGADLVPFSLLTDTKLPANVRGIYIPGGPIEQHALELSKNQELFDQLRAFGLAGGVVYAEGSAIAYLSKFMSSLDGTTLEMAGLIPFQTTFLERFTEFSSPDRVIEVRQVVTNTLLKEGECIRGLQASRWAYRPLEKGVSVAMEAFTREHIINGADYLHEHPPTAGGFQPRANIIATPYLLNWATCPKFAERFVVAALGQR